MPTAEQIRYKIAKTPLRAAVVWLRHRFLNDSDVYLASYPRSGSTWLKFMLYEAFIGEVANFTSDFETIPPVGRHFKVLPLLPGKKRLLKTHEAYRRVFRKAIYLVRDDRDVVLAEYAFMRLRGVERQGFDSFLERHLKGKTHGFGFGSWDQNVKSWLDAQKMPENDIHVVRYEDLRMNTEEVFTHILEFLEAPKPREVVRRIVENNSIERMRATEDKVRGPRFKAWRNNYSHEVRFVRTGLVGGWRKVLTESQLRRIEGYTKDTLIRLGYPLS